MEDQVGPLELTQALGGQTTRAVGEVRVGEDGDSRQR
jgi:hypothetical protein